MAFTIRDDIPVGTARGNTCYACGSIQRTKENGEKERFVDANITIDMEGYLMFCESCMLEVGEKLGMLSKKKVTAIVEELDKLHQENTQLRLEVSLNEDLVTTVTRLQDFHAKKGE